MYKKFTFTALFILSISLVDYSSAAVLDNYSNYGVIMHNQIAQFTNINIRNDPFGYSSQYTDNESGLQYLQIRYYNPKIMRFIQMDNYQLLNRYAYANENPIMDIDPSGHSAVGEKGDAEMNEAFSDDENFLGLGVGSEDFIGLLSVAEAVLAPELDMPEIISDGIELETTLSTENEASEEFDKNNIESNYNKKPENISEKIKRITGENYKNSDAINSLASHAAARPPNPK